VNRTTLGFGLLLSLGLANCAPSAPPRWAEGGASLLIAPAHWQRIGADPVEIRADGRVLEGGDVVFVIDRVGRVTDEDYDAYAVLAPDGRLTGTDDLPLGYIGVNNATPPTSRQAWLSLQADGSALFFKANGERIPIGKWTGCNGANRRTCTLVTQLLTERNLRVTPSYGPYGAYGPYGPYGPYSPYGPRFGVGVGVGF
jgi:hypothetical protein